LKYNFIIVFFTCFVLGLQAQIQGIIVEEKTRRPVPFASLSYTSDKQQQRLIADKQGRFSIPFHRIEHLTVSGIGYKTKEIDFNSAPASLLVVELEEQDFLIRELLVTPGENPAIRIIRQVLANKGRNNFKNYDRYSYRCYFKTTLGMDTPETENADSSRANTKENSDLFISETVSLCTKSGQAREEKIIATRTSGMKSPVFGQVSYTLFYKAISFYEQTIQIFGETESSDKMQTDYLSPLSNACLGAYQYQLEEEYVTGNDTVFEIIYFPKKNKNFNALTGRMFISSKGYALTGIVAGPHE
jgi:hypothetical protein